MKICNITVSPKKNETQDTRWVVSQSRPFPTIYSHGSALQWQSADGMLSRYGSDIDNPSIGNTYHCYLLRSDFVEANADNSRVDHAGYKPTIADGPNPGSITLRGQSLGEIHITVSNNYPSFDVRGYGDTLTPGERSWLKEQVLPSLQSFINTNAAELKAEALEKLKTDTTSRLKDAKNQLEALEKQMSRAIAILEK